MISIQDLFQWNRFITPTVIQTFYWLTIGVVVLVGLSGMLTGLSTMAISPFVGLLMILSSLAGIALGILAARIGAELVLVVFRISEHLGAIREQGRLR